MLGINTRRYAVLPLVLTGKWYDMIASGYKHEEYRDLTDYWTRRIHNWIGRPGVHVVAFSRGYRKADMFFMCSSCKPTWRINLHPEWGEPSTPHYVMRLGARISLEGMQ